MDDSVIPINTKKEFCLWMVGGKGLNIVKLARMKRINVPSGFIVSTLTFKKFLEFNKIKIDGNVKERILGSRFPENLKKEILEAYTRNFKPEEALIVRSSSTLEDVRRTSFAGQFESFLNVKGFNDLLHHIKKCWCSAFSERVCAYLKAMRVKKRVSMAVIVQKLIKADSAGIMFTVNPVTKNKNEIFIESNFGLGPSVASGLVTPDTFIIDKNSMKIVNKRLGSKKTMTVIKAEGTENIQTPEEKQGIYSLKDEQIVELAKLGRRIEEFFGCPQDIEWSVEKDKIFITQTRPITT